MSTADVVAGPQGSAGRPEPARLARGVLSSFDIARIIFSSGREGLLPAVTGRLTERGRTPWVAFLIYLGLALGLTYVFGWNTDPVTFFGEIATLGTIRLRAAGGRSAAAPRPPRRAV